MPAQHCLAPDPPAGCERTGQNQIHIPIRRSGSTGGVVCPAHLPQDLGLTEYLRVQSGCHDEQMANCRLA
jgi:hypothetical protein